ncbi:flavin reductase family protein [Saccharopolyspora pogona]|uniref:flavin reductase family protein n=1 Tax=Saccharopolyspora pogona TaxID=333966 RepID=UPI001686508C|nr:flavin reductase family protein [Saccharopolyspora pogona]
MTDPISIRKRTSRTAVEPIAFREILGNYASGVTVISSHDGHEPIGFTCQSFYSVSLEPPLVSFSVMRTSRSYPRIRETGRFAINVLSQDQRAVSDQFARSGPDKWSGVSWQFSCQETPILDGALTWLDCELDAEHEAGDHFVVIGRVCDMGAAACHENLSPLLFFQGQYRDLVG